MRLRSRASPRRCAYCHSGFGKEDIRCSCGGSHVECAMVNGECPACGAAAKPSMTLLEKERDRLEAELERVESELNAVEETMEKLEDEEWDAKESDPGPKTLVAGIEHIGPLDCAHSGGEFGVVFAGATCSSCHRSYTQRPSAGHGTLCAGCWDKSQGRERMRDDDDQWKNPSMVMVVVALIAILVIILAEVVL